MADTTPLRRTPIGTRSERFKDIETNDLTKHYTFAANGIYGNRQYADISLITKERKLN
ncbi:MAG: hypothetical protein OEL69_04380 [Nitrosopumilus sp.]|jgi:hypothetical protein|nr:hypothetical protein [Nitrosopumilus sp.]